ncbi:DUF975 family protein [Clostridium sp. CF012]|uniref:DUF975 family protein n=1 Tax=Clostridium sp. CF012 TaxID=2843319 RepID=UPI001C0C6D4E|nr:DUF975 family protein [Clostridium sp. CF012]MBU3146554.1 DUF975 family protein [Clostridium sp. CF012]
MENNVYEMKTNAELKELAKLQLTGKWGKSALLTLIYFVIGILPGQLLLSKFNFSSLTTSLVDIVLIAPVTIGVSFCYLKLIRETNYNVIDILNGFKYFITGVVVYGIVDSTNILSALVSNIITVNVVTEQFLSLVFGLLSIFLYLMFSMVYYILIDNPQIGVIGALTGGLKLIHGQIGRLFILQLSFLGWILLAILSLGIGMLWLLPYIEVTTANLYLDLKNREANKSTLYYSK